MRKALIISVSTYNGNNLPPLDVCKKNGEEMYKVLMSLGYEIEDKYRLIGEVKFMTMRRAIIDFLANYNVKRSSTLLFYFSGHGINAGDGNVYLASSEVDPSFPIEKGFSFDDLSKAIELSVSKKIVTILDCVFSGAAHLEK